MLINMRHLYILLFILVSVNCYGQKTRIDQKIIRVNDMLYVASHGERFAVDQKKVVLKPKSSVKQISDSLTILSKSKGGKLLIEVPEGKDVTEYVKELENTNNYESVEYKSDCNVYFSPNDSEISHQHNNLTQINAYDAWNYSTGSSTIKVAIIDTGIKRDHEDLGYGNDSYTNVSYSLGYDYMEGTSYHVPTDSHGTEVAGVLGAKTNNGIGIAGISGGNHCKGITMISYRLVNENGIGASHLYDEAIRQAVDDGAKVINLSIGHSENADINSALYYAETHGVTVVCSAGFSTDTEVPYPASNPYTIAVGYYSSNLSSTYLGAGLDLVAPGYVYTTNISTNKYGINSGTSFSAPMVAGTVALMLSVNPSLTPAKIRYILRKTATKVSGYTYDSNGWNGAVGYGLLNVLSAVINAMDLNISGPQLISSTGSYSVENLPSGLTVSWSLTDSYYNSNCISQNTPEINQCKITRNGSHDMLDATLTATIKYNGNIVRKITKSHLYAYSGFKGTYYNGVTTKQVNLPYPMYVKKNANLSLQSPNLINATVTHEGDAAVSSFSFNSTTGTINFYLTSNGTCLVRVNCDNGDHFDLPFIVTDNTNILNVAIGNGQLEVSLVPVEDEEMRNLGSSDLVDDLTKGETQTWMLEVYNATTGEKVFSQEVDGTTFTIDTTGWKPGVYVVRAVIGDEVLNEKVVVN